MTRGRRVSDPLDHVLASCVVDETTGCWNWQRSLNAHGYGNVRIDSKLWYTHRLAYTLIVGDIPDGLDLDHLCRNRACCNPAHLEPVTRAVNLHRGDTLTARNAAKTHCPQGHAYSPENTYVGTTKRGSKTRSCATCVKASERRRRASRKVSVAA